jgi:general secretion pathway protein H
MRRTGTAGFTLIELIVVLAVLALAMGLVLTHGPVRSHRLELDGAVRELAGALRLARSRAIAEERPVAFAVGAFGYRLDRGAPVPWHATVSPEGNSLVVFTPEGGSSGGRIILREGERTVAIGVDWLTGRVIVR